MKNTKKNQRLLRALNNGRNWMAVGSHIESVADNVSDLTVDGFSEGVDHESACELATEIARRLNDYPNVVRADKRKRDRIRAMKDVLKRIAEWPANSNSDPDVMGDALDEIQRIAQEAAKL